MKFTTETRASRLIAIWIGIIVLFMGVLVSNDRNIPIFQIGPNENLHIFSVAIDTGEKYIAVVSFCFINNGIRTLNHNILQPFIINTIQGKSNKSQTSCHINDRLYELSFI